MDEKFILIGGIHMEVVVLMIGWISVWGCFVIVTLYGLVIIKKREIVKFWVLIIDKPLQWGLVHKATKTKDTMTLGPGWSLSCYYRCIVGQSTRQWQVGERPQRLFEVTNEIHPRLSCLTYMLISTTIKPNFPYYHKKKITWSS